MNALGATVWGGRERLALAVVIAGLAVTGVSPAGTIVAKEGGAPSSAVKVRPPVVGDGYNEHGGIYIVGDEGPSQIAVELDRRADEWVVTDEAGVGPHLGSDPDESSGCYSITARKVRCEKLGPELAGGLGGGPDRLTVAPSVRMVRVAGQFGDDRLEIAPGGSAKTTFWGEEGHDVLISGAWASNRRGAAGDFLDGGDGDDVIRGRSGPDRLFAGKGADTLRGGAGNDRLEAADQARDRLLDCNSGRRDEVHGDRFDPKPVACEVRRVHPSVLRKRLAQANERQQGTPRHRLKRRA